MTLPTIHLNGTSAKVLLEDYCDAAQGLRRAMDCLAATGPNGRDYYLQGPDAISRALDEHTDRLKRLRSVLKEVEAIAEHVARAAVAK